MKKLWTVLMAMILASSTLIASTQTAEAHRWRGRGGGGGAVAAAIIAGVAIAALSNRHHRRNYYSSYDDGYGYNYYPRRRYYRSYGYAPVHSFGRSYHRGWGNRGWGHNRGWRQARFHRNRW